MLCVLTLGVWVCFWFEHYKGMVHYNETLYDGIHKIWDFIINQVNEQCSTLAFGVVDVGLCEQTTFISSILPSSSSFYAP